MVGYAVGVLSQLVAGLAGADPLGGIPAIPRHREEEHGFEYFRVTRIEH